MRISDGSSYVCSSDLFTVLPEIAVAKIREDAPFQSSCYIGCGVTTGVGAVINTAKVQVGDNVVIFGLGGLCLHVIQGSRLAGRSEERRVGKVCVSTCKCRG